MIHNPEEPGLKPKPELKPELEPGTAQRTGPMPEIEVRLAPGLALASLNDVLRRAIRPAPDQESWVEVLMDQLPPNWRGLVWTDVARAGPLTPNGRAFLPQAEWEARARRLRAEATTILRFRDALVLADRGPLSDDLEDAVRLDPWEVWDLGGMGPYVSDRLQEPEPSRPG